MNMSLHWLRIRAIARRHWYVLLRSPHRLFDVTVWPLIDVLLFGSIGVYFTRGGGPPTHASQVAFGYMLAGVLLWHVVYQSSIGLATGFMEETWSRNLLNLIVTPMTEIDYIGGVALFGLVKLATGLIVVALTGLGFYAFHVTDLGVAAIPIVAILLAVGWDIALIVIALTLRFGSSAEPLAWGLLFLVMPLSGVFYPIRALPWLLRPIARALPTTHAFTAARAIYAGRSLPWREVGIAAVSAVGLTALALMFTAAMLATFRRRGFVTRYS
ncbi:MAG: type transport system permease protein [Actinomycetota bacterium]|jgi:ABC-2 type transport system permease protein